MGCAAFVTLCEAFETMAEPDKDDLADALARLASGDAPSAPEGVPSEQVPLTPKKDRPKRPQAPGLPSTPVAPKNPGLASGAAMGRPADRAVSSPASRPNAPGVQPPV